eukprot:5530848-Prymnesium_polylepis.1
MERDRPRLRAARPHQLAAEPVVTYRSQLQRDTIFNGKVSFNRYRTAAPEDDRYRPAAPEDT